MRTLLLTPDNWDLCLDSDGNPAVAADPYSQAQDAACAIKLFLGEYWYNTALGIPYFGTTLGKHPPLQLLKAQNVNAALTVPGVTAANCFIAAIKDRVVSGQVQITNVSGQTAAVSFSQ